MSTAARFRSARNKIYVERRGKLEKTDVKFRDNDHLLQIIDRIVSKVGRRVDETSPMVDARLLDGEHRPRRLDMCHARRKDWAPAIEALRHAAALEPENRQNRNMLSYCLARAGKTDEALVVFTRRVGEARAHYNLTRMLHHMNQDTEARQHLQAAVKADPQFDPAQRMLAQLEGREPADPAVLQAGFDLPAGATVPMR